MKKTAKARRTRRLPNASLQGKERSVASDEVDAILSRIFSSIATLLVSSGYGYRRINDLTRLAFVRAAEAINTREGIKTSIARIAATTGLTRLEVSRLQKA